MKLLGIAGYSGSGKTTLLEKVIPLLKQQGLRISVIKHAHHNFDIDRPGKDSFRHREAGAHEVMIASGHRWALMHELRQEAEPGLEELCARLSPCDLVLVEGFKSGDFPKLEVWREEPGREPLAPAWPGIRAIATDAAASPVAGVPRIALDDLGAIVDFVLANATALAR